MSDPASIAVLGVGAQTALGRSAAASAAAVRAGLSAASDHPSCLDRTREPMVVCGASWLPIDVQGADRFASLAEDAALEALKSLPDLAETRPIPVLVGVPEARPGRPADLDAQLSAKLEGRLRERARLAQVTSLPYGHASGLMAIEAALSIFERDEASFCLIGGVDSYIERETLEWIEDIGQLHTRDHSWGFIPGEAAGFCLLASTRAASALGVPALAHVIGVASAIEENRIKTETVCLGRGLTTAIQGAIQGLAPDARIDQMICDLNGEPYRANELAFSVARLARRFAAPGEFLAPADCWGDVGAASGPLFAALAVAAGARGYGRGPLNLLWASSEGGPRCAALLSVVAASPPYH